MNFTGCIECGNTVIENKALQLCASCASRQRKEDRQAKTNALKKPVRLQKFSEKKAEKQLPFAVLRRKYLNENPVCEVHLEGCLGVSSEIHHITFSADDYLNVATFKAVCSPCHRRLEDLPAIKRRELGLLI